jgi:fimbrial chaperone protein
VQAEVGEPTLDKGALAVQVRNPGNQHVRVLKVVVSDGASHRQEVAGWYALAGSQRTYTLNIPPEICRKSKTLHVTVEGEALRVDRKLDVDPARCV